MNVVEEFRVLVGAGGPALAPLGDGASPERLAGLAAIARRDVTLARLVEAHVDAVQILREAGRRPRAAVAYGVWAADDPRMGLTLRRSGDGSGTLVGSKPFCSGAPFLDRALVTVRTPEVLLIDVDLAAHRHRIDVDASAWITPAFQETGTATVTFDTVPIGVDDVVGPPNWYLDRPGFWHGACAPAACWAGGAQGLVDWTLATAAASAPDTHRDTAAGASSAMSFQLDALLALAGSEIDADPANAVGARVRALQLRHGVERTCVAIIDQLGRAFGPRPLAMEAAVHRRVLDVQLYIRQCHGERDLEVLGRQLRESRPPPGDRTNHR